MYTLQVACGNCHVRLLHPERGSLCDVCNSMLDAVCRPWFHQAQDEYLAENERRAQHKRELMSGKEQS